MLSYGRRARYKVRLHNSTFNVNVRRYSNLYLSLMPLSGRSGGGFSSFKCIKIFAKRACLACTYTIVVLQPYPGDRSHNLSPVYSAVDRLFFALSYHSW